MTYLVWYNKKYKRQFEAVVKDKEWKAAKKKYGSAAAAAILVAHLHKVKSRKNISEKRERTASNFVLGSLIRPDIFGEPVIKVGRSKKSVLDKGHSELIVTSTEKRGIRSEQRRKRRRHARV